MAPTDGDKGKPGKPAPRPKSAAKRPAAKRTPAKPAPAPARNGHSEWVDYSAQTTSWDPWDDGDGDGDGTDAEARGLNRTLGEWLEAVVPPEAQIHFFNAGREFAAGIQTTLDHHMNRGDEDGGGGAGALRIEIE